MNKKFLYNEIMSKISGVIKKTLNESINNMTYEQYRRIYTPEQRIEIEKMLMRVDLLDSSYVNEY